MRYRQGHKEETRRRIVEAASARFREAGVEGVGVAGLMAEAGLTHGGFYAHFKSKEDLVRKAIAASLACTTDAFERAARKSDDGLETIVRGYLNARHRDEPGEGCIGASLAAELARHPKPTRQVFAASIGRLVELIAAELPAGDEDARHRRALAIFSLMMGALQLARAEPDAARSDEILQSAADAALALGRADI